MGSSKMVSQYCSFNTNKRVVTFLPPLPKFIIDINILWFDYVHAWNQFKHVDCSFTPNDQQKLKLKHEDKIFSL